MCQKFTPTVVESVPTSHSVEDGSYFPSPVQSVETAEPPVVASSQPPPETSSKKTEEIPIHRMPKQEIELEPRNNEDESGLENSSDESINFDEFFDLAVYKNQFLNSEASSLSLNLIFLSFTMLLI